MKNILGAPWSLASLVCGKMESSSEKLRLLQRVFIFLRHGKLVVLYESEIYVARRLCTVVVEV